MKKIISIVLSIFMIVSAFSATTVFAADKSYDSFEEFYSQNEFVTYSDSYKPVSAKFSGVPVKVALVKYTPNTTDGYTFTFSWKGDASDYSYLGMDIPFNSTKEPELENFVFMGLSNSDVKNNSNVKTSVVLKKGVTYYFAFSVSTTSDASLKITHCAHHKRASSISQASVFSAGHLYSNCAECGKVFKSKTYPKKKMVVSKIKPKKRGFTVKYNGDAAADGYQVQYATNKKFSKNKKTVTVKGYNTTKKTIKKLKKGKKYYVRVRAYYKTNQKKVYSAWSAKKIVKTK